MYTWQKNRLMEEQNCPLCNNNDFSQLFVRSDGLPLHECKVCGFVYLGVRPDQVALENYYNSSYFEGSSTYNHYFNYAEAVTDLDYCPRLMRLTPFIGEVKGKKVLEVGCAAGATLELLKRRGAIVKGVEISSQATEIAVEKYGLNVVQSAFDPKSHSGEKYDIIMLFDVLEHIPNPRYILDELTNLLTASGMLVLTVPNFSCFDQVGSQWIGVQSYWEHLNFFRPRVLKKSLETRGYSVVELYTFTASDQKNPNGMESKFRNFRHILVDKIGILHPVMRMARIIKFKLIGPHELPKSSDMSGMDLFCVAQKGLGRVSKL